MKIWSQVLAGGMIAIISAGCTHGAKDRLPSAEGLPSNSTRQTVNDATRDIVNLINGQISELINTEWELDTTGGSLASAAALAEYRVYFIKNNRNDRSHLRRLVVLSQQGSSANLEAMSDDIDMNLLSSSTTSLNSIQLNIHPPSGVTVVDGRLNGLAANDANPNGWIFSINMIFIEEEARAWRQRIYKINFRKQDNTTAEGGRQWISQFVLSGLVNINHSTSADTADITRTDCNLLMGTRSRTNDRSAIRSGEWVSRGPVAVTMPNLNPNEINLLKSLSRNGAGFRSIDDIQSSEVQTLLQIQRLCSE